MSSIRASITSYESHTVKGERCFVASALAEGHGAFRLTGKVGQHSVRPGGVYDIVADLPPPAAEGAPVPMLRMDDIVSIVETDKSIADGAGDALESIALSSLQARSVNDRVNVTAVIITADRETSLTRENNKKRTFTVMDSSVEGPVGVCAHSDAADHYFEPGSVVHLKRAKVGSFQSKPSLVIFDEPIVVRDSGLRALYEQSSVHKRISIAELVGAPADSRVTVKAVVSRARKEAQETSTGGRWSMMQLVDQSGYRADCFLFDGAAEIDAPEGAVVLVTSALVSERPTGRRLTVDNSSTVTLAPGDDAMEKWWSEHWWTEFRPLAAPATRESKSVGLSAVPGLGRNVRIDIEGELEIDDGAWYLRGEDVRVPLKVINADRRDLSHGVHVRIEKALTNDKGGVTVFVDTPVVRVE